MSGWVLAKIVGFSFESAPKGPRSNPEGHNFVAKIVGFSFESAPKGPRSNPEGHNFVAKIVNRSPLGVGKEKTSF